MWKYNGTVSYLSVWQTVMFITCIVYIIPFPFTLALGIKLLQNKKISSGHFILGCFIPFPFLFMWPSLVCLIKKPRNDRSLKVLPVESEASI